MAKTTQAQEQTMEEILASIRRIISDDEARGASARPPARPASNVSHLFAEPPAPSADNVVELPIEPAAPVSADAFEEEDYSEPESENPGLEEVAIDEAAFAAAIQPDQSSRLPEPAPALAV